MSGSSQLRLVVVLCDSIYFLQSCLTSQGLAKPIGSQGAHALFNGRFFNHMGATPLTYKLLYVFINDQQLGNPGSSQISRIEAFLAAKPFVELSLKSGSIFIGTQL